MISGSKVIQMLHDETLYITTFPELKQPRDNICEHYWLTINTAILKDAIICRRDSRRMGYNVGHRAASTVRFYYYSYFYYYYYYYY